MKTFRNRLASGLFLCGCVLMLAAGDGPSLSAQATKPPIDFSGDWVLDEANMRHDGPRPPFCGRECRITQGDKTLTVTVGNRTGSYRLDGVPEKSTVRAGEFASERVVTARWEGGRLVILTKVGSAPESKVALSIEDGALVILSNTRGFEMSPAETKVTYTRRAKRLPVQRP